MIESRKELDWTFLKLNTREYTHIYHDYPARMIPQIPRQLIDILDQKVGNTLFDPYCGSGSVLVEGELSGLNTIGCDINPLAILISTAKTDYSIIPAALEKEINNFMKFTLSPQGEPLIIQNDRLSFWFKESVVKPLGLILMYISKIADPSIKRFFEVAASETIRESSNTRKGEFKLYRYNEETLKKHNPDPFVIMKSKLIRNFNGYKEFHLKISSMGNKPQTNVFLLNTANSIPPSIIKKESVDIVITSPPYGDSHTTVAYGQYSKLSSEWLGIYQHNVDRASMGGKIYKEDISLNCDPLEKAIDSIMDSKPKRAMEVSSFYHDLKSSIRNISKTIKPDGYACYVVANRRVSGIQLPTHQAIEFFFEEFGFYHEETFTRSIPNKRMPSKNSPTNIAGETSSTMLNEHIVLMRKTKNCENESTSNAI